MRQVAVVTSAMIAVTCTAGVLGTWAAWHRYQVAVDYAAGEPGVADYVGAANVAANVAVLWLMAYGVTFVTFLTWSWRARCNAERLNTLPHRLPRGWVIGGWLVPVFPLIILEDVWRTSHPSCADASHSRDLPRVPLVHSWWYAAAACALTGLWLAAAQQAEPTLDALLDVASTTTVLAGLQIVTAGLVIMVIRRITQWQLSAEG